MMRPKSLRFATDRALRLAFISGAIVVAVWIFESYAGNNIDSGAARFLTVCVGVTAAGTGMMFLAPRAALGPIAWFWGISTLFVGLATLLSIGLVLIPLALVWIALAIRISGRPSRGSMMLASVAVGTLGWSALLLGLLA